MTIVKKLKEKPKYMKQKQESMGHELVCSKLNVLLEKTQDLEQIILNLKSNFEDMGKVSASTAKSVKDVCADGNLKNNTRTYYEQHRTHCMRVHKVYCLRKKIEGMKVRRNASEKTRRHVSNLKYRMTHDDYARSIGVTCRADLYKYSR